MHFFSAEELRRVLDLEALIDALERGHTGGRPQLADSLIGPPDGRYMVRSAHNGGDLIGTKLITIFPANPGRSDLPSVQAVVVLFGGDDGRPKALLEATELTYWKTAADSALGSRQLSRDDSEILVVAGAGGLAPWLVRAHRVVRPGLQQVLVWNRTAERAKALVDELSQEGVQAEVASELESAVRAADIVTTATMASEPVLKGAWLRAGVHVDLVGGYSAETREADDAVFSRGRVFVNCMDTALDGVGDIDGPLRSGAIRKEDILGDHFDLVSGSVQGRQNPEDITVFKNAGGAHLDLMIAAALVHRAEAGAA